MGVDMQEQRETRCHALQSRRAGGKISIHPYIHAAEDRNGGETLKLAR
jgi:hypothetical protein